MPDAARTILLSGYFGPEARDPKLDYFVRLDAALRETGHRLYVLNMNGNRLPAGLRGESFPFLVEKSHRLPLDRFIPPAAIDPAIAQAASIDAACWHRSPARESVRLLLFREHLRRVLDRERPCLHIAWHQFFSFHFALPSMLAEFGVPLLFAEFGPLPGTIIFDREGQMAESAIARRSDEFASTPVSEAEIRDAENFLARVRAEKRTRKPQNDANTVRDALRERAAGGRKVIFYAGQYDCRTGMIPRTLPNARLHSPFFTETLDALSFLSRLAKRNDWLILFKPHPLADHAPGDLARIEAPDRVVSVPGASVFECFEHAQLVSTIVSQVSYMSLIHGRPCLMLGRNQLSGKGCAYEPQSTDDIEAHVNRAFANGVTAEQKAKWKIHVAQLLKTSVFAFDEDFNAPSLRGLPETAEFLAANGAEFSIPVNRLDQPSGIVVSDVKRIYKPMAVLSPILGLLRGRPH